MITADFETRSCIDLPRVGAMRYATDVSTQALCLRWVYDDEDEVHLWHRGHPWIAQSARPDELLDRIAAGELFEAHNAKFEFLIWNHTLTREFPEFDVQLQLEQMRCSAAKASCLSLPRALGDATNALDLEHRKDPDGRRLINRLSKPMRHRKDPRATAIIKQIRKAEDEDEIAALQDQLAAILAEVQEIEFCEEEIEHRRNWDYCGRDVVAERGLSNFCPEMTERELQYWQMDFRMNLRGIRLDADAAKHAIKLCEREVIRLNGEMQTLTDGEVVGGSKRIPFRAWANKQLANVGEPPIPDTRADTLSFRLYGVPTKAAEEAKAALKPEMDEKWLWLGETGARIKRGMEICLEVNRSSVAKFRQMDASVCPDGRLHDIMLYNGADRTGRWSGQGVQPHNFVRGYSKDMPSVWETLLTRDPLTGDGDLEWITLVEGQPLPTLAKACRGALIASEGHELYAADFNAIEARKLAWMSACTPLLTLFQSGGDPYCDMASAIYQREITKANKTERQMGKKAVLGLGYAMGWEKFQFTVFNEEGIWLDDEFCQTVVRIYRKDKYPHIPRLWRAVEKAAIGAVQEGGEWSAGGDPVTGAGAVTYFVSGRFLHCRLPSGRLLAYLDPEVHTKINYRFAAINERGTPCTVTFPARIGVAMNRVRYNAERLAEKQRKVLTDDAPETFLSPHLSFMGRDTYTKKWKRCGTHGGSLVENFDQASSRDLLAEAMWRVDQDGRFGLLLSIHDEVIAEAPIGTCDLPEFEAMMSEVPWWAPGMPISAEGWIGERLRK